MYDILYYTDGAARGNQNRKTKEKIPSGWGFVMLKDKDEKIEILLEEFDGKNNSTNNQMELMAVLNALKNRKKIDITSINNINIYSDSAYVVNGVNFWMESWVERNWLTVNKKQVKNIMLWKGIKRELDYFRKKTNIKVNLIKVRGHNGNKWNKMADKLANKGADIYDI